MRASLAFLERVIVMSDHLELLTMGRIGVDLYPAGVDTRLEDVESFTRTLGGSPTNVAVAAARHGPAYRQ